MAVTTVVLGADKAGDLSRALALMVVADTVAVAHVYHDDDCPCASDTRSMEACCCDEGRGRGRGSRVTRTVDTRRLAGATCGGQHARAEVAT